MSGDLLDFHEYLDTLKRSNQTAGLRRIHLINKTGYEQIRNIP